MLVVVLFLAVFVMVVALFFFVAAAVKVRAMRVAALELMVVARDALFGAFIGEGGA